LKILKGYKTGNMHLFKAINRVLLIAFFTIALPAVSVCIADTRKSDQAINPATPAVIRYIKLQDETYPQSWPHKDSFNVYSLKNPTLSPGYYLVQTTITNHTKEDTLLFDAGYHRLKSVKIEVLHSGGKTENYHSGMMVPLSARKYYNNRLLTGLAINPGETVECRIKIYCHEYFSLAMQADTKQNLLSDLNAENILYALFAGIFLSMILYNLFIFLTTRDRIYLLYVCYNFFMAYSQLGLLGFTQHYIFPESPVTDYWIYMISGSMVGTFGCLFIASYLNIKNYSALIYKSIMLIAALFPSYLIFDLLGFYTLKEIAYDILGLCCFALFYISVYISIRKGNLQTKFLLAGWSLFMLGYVTFILKNEGLLPYNLFTHYGMITGSALEMLLLSFALADRINTLRKDNAKKQEEIITQLEKNEQFLRKSKQLELDKERLKKEILISEYESLKKQINPHFLFNSLNVLTDLVHEEHEMAETFVTELSKAYRYILECEQESLVSLQTELRFIRSYIFLLKIRFEENLQISIEIPESENRLIAPLTLQLLVENAVKHNIISSAQPLKIDIFTIESYIIVSNNIQLRRDKEKSTGKGLKNIQSRYQYISGDDVQVIYSSKQFMVKIPLVGDSQILPSDTDEISDYRR
jgi:sensor histidine kinase YesM